jgi:hypothetical protein
MEKNVLVKRRRGWGFVAKRLRIYTPRLLEVSADFLEPIISRGVLDRRCPLRSFVACDRAIDGSSVTRPATAGGTRLLWTTRIDALFGSILGLGCLGLLVALPGLPWSPPSALVLHWLHLKLLNIARTVKCYSKLTLSTKVPLKSKKGIMYTVIAGAAWLLPVITRKKSRGMGRACAYGSERERKRDRHLGETL